VPTENDGELAEQAVVWLRCSDGGRVGEMMQTRWVPSIFRRHAGRGEEAS